MKNTAEKDPESLNKEIILPVKRRQGTDKICLILIICCWFAMTIIGFCSLGIIKSSYLSEGDPNYLIHGVDYNGNICSIDGVVKSLPFKLMPNYFGTNLNSAGKLVPNLYAICVSSCPKEGDKVSDPYNPTTTWNIEYDTTSFMNNCIYLNIPNYDNTSGVTILGDFITSYKIIAIFGFILSIVCSFLFLLVIRIPLILRSIVWSCIFLILAILAAGGYFLLDQAKSNTITNNESYAENRTEIMMLNVLGGTLTGCAVLWLCVICFMRQRIALAISLIKESSVALLSMPLLCLLPFLQTVLFAGFTGIWLIYSIYLVSAGDLTTYTDSTTGYSYKLMEYSTTSKQAIVFLLFIWFWSVGFLEALGQIIISHVILVWYFAENRYLIVSSQVLRSTLYCAFYHGGSAAFGSLLIAVIRLLRMALEYIKLKLSANNRIVGNNTLCPSCSVNCCVRYVLCCVGCLMWAFDKCIKFLNKHAYIQVAMFGTSFMMSAKRAYFLILRNLGRLATISVIGDFVVFIGKMSITLSCAAISYLYMSFYMYDDMNSLILPTVFIGFIAYITSTLFLGILSATSDSMLQAVIVDEELSMGVANIKYKGLRDLVIAQQNEFRALNDDVDPDEEDAECDEFEEQEDEEEEVIFNSGNSSGNGGAAGDNGSNSSDETSDMLKTRPDSGAAGVGIGNINSRLNKNSQYRANVSQYYKEQQMGARQRGNGSLWSSIKQEYTAQSSDQQQLEESEALSPIGANNNNVSSSVEMRTFGASSSLNSHSPANNLTNRNSPRAASPTDPAVVDTSIFSSDGGNARYDRYKTNMQSNMAKAVASNHSGPPPKPPKNMVFPAAVVNGDGSEVTRSSNPFDENRVVWVDASELLLFDWCKNRSTPGTHHIQQNAPIFQTMSIICKIPKVICTDILAGWCLLKDLVKLDSANANNTERNEVHTLYNTNFFQMECKKPAMLKAFAWIRLRQIKLGSLVIDGKLVGDLKLWNDIKIDTTNVHCLSVHNFKKDKLVPSHLITIINSCPRLASLTVDKVYGFSGEVLLAVKPEIYQQLRCLRLTDCSQITVKPTLGHLTPLLGSLIKLHLHFSNAFDSAGTEPNAITLLQNNPNLTSIHVTGLECGDALIDSIISLFPDIEYLKVDARWATPSAVVRLTSCLSLVEIDFPAHFVCKLNKDKYGSVTSKIVTFNSFVKPGRLELNEGGDFTVNNMPGIMNMFAAVSRCTSVSIHDIFLTDEMIIALATHNPTLQSFCISYSALLFTGASIKHLIKECKALVSLKLVSNALSDTELVDIFSEPNNLTSLTINDHSGISQLTAKYITDYTHTPKLKSINFKNCPNVHGVVVEEDCDPRGRKIKWTYDE